MVRRMYDIEACHGRRKKNATYIYLMMKLYYFAPQMIANMAGVSIGFEHLHISMYPMPYHLRCCLLDTNSKERASKYDLASKPRAITRSYIEGINFSPNSCLKNNSIPALYKLMLCAIRYGTLPADILSITLQVSSQLKNWLISRLG